VQPQTHFYVEIVSSDDNGAVIAVIDGPMKGQGNGAFDLIDRGETLAKPSKRDTPATVQ
jgi:hypothetical protein